MELRTQISRSRTLILGFALISAFAGPAMAQPKPPAPPPAKAGWMDIKDCPEKHPGPWQKIQDTPEQAAMRKELADKGRIVFTSNRDGNWEIYSCNPDGGDQKNLTKNPGWDSFPRWTSDGKRIVFFSDRDSKAKLSTWRDQLMQRNPHGLWGFYQNWTDHGELFQPEDKIMAESGIYIMDADGSNVKLLAKAAQYASVSPDGKYVVFERRGFPTVQNLATGEEFVATRRYYGAGWWPEYSPDGNRILVSSSGDTVGREPPALIMATIFTLKPDYKATGQMWHVAIGGLNLCPRWRPDGKGLVLVRGSREMALVEVDLAESPSPTTGLLEGQAIGLATPADQYMHAYPAYGPGGKFIAFSLSPIHYLIRERKGTQGVEIKDMGYKPWTDGNQIIWQELCVGRAVPGKDNAWVQLTDGGFANIEADWYYPGLPRKVEFPPPPLPDYKAATSQPDVVKTPKTTPPPKSPTTQPKQGK